MNTDGIVDKIEESGVLNENIENAVAAINEGVRELLQAAIALYKSPHPSDSKDAVEIEGGVSEFVALFNAEFIALTNISNAFRIRHHETDKIDITDIRHYDYFFNRCLSLIALSLQYLH